MNPSLLICLMLLCADTDRTKSDDIITMKTANLHIRDPFVLPVPAEGKYYLYGTMGTMWAEKGEMGFDTYRSSDLENWEGPLPAFRTKPGFWATHHFWAPEVHLYEGKYYMFASFKANDVSRGTQILISDKPEGPFVPLTEKPVTPSDWECLDGTLYIDPKGEPWMVFCHEWVQVGDGEICAMCLSKDLKTAVAKPVLLFKASDAKWVNSVSKDKPDYVTDGPFLHRTKSGALLMLWSSFGRDGYSATFARSESGEITGPWIQESEPLGIKDAGHSMIFRTFGGDLMLAMHQPNENPYERAIFRRIKEIDGRIEIEESKTKR